MEWKYKATVENQEVIIVVGKEEPKYRVFNKDNVLIGEGSTEKEAIESAREYIREREKFKYPHS